MGRRLSRPASTPSWCPSSATLATRPHLRRPDGIGARWAHPKLARVSHFVVITGMSGAGRSQAADILEDLGFFVIDNLPPTLIPKGAELAQGPGSSIAKVVLVVGTGPYHHEVLPALTALRRQGMHLRILFLEASTDVLV